MDNLQKVQIVVSLGESSKQIATNQPGLLPSKISLESIINGDLGRVEYSFIAITPRSTLTQGGRIC